MIRRIDEKPLIDGKGTIFYVKNEPNQVRDLMFREAVDFAVVPSNMGAMLYNKGLPYILAAVPVWGTLYLFGTDTTIREWADLKGKRISLMAKGMTPDIMFRLLAERNGLNPDTDLVPDYSFPTHIELANAVIAGVSELAVISEPLVSVVMSKSSGVRPIFSFNEEWIKLFGDTIPFAQTALMVHKDLYETSPGLIEKYLLELEKSISYVNTHIPEASVLMEKYGILPDREIAAASIPGCYLRFTSAWKERQGIEEYLKVFYNFNPLSIGGKLPDESFYFQKPAD